MMSSLNFDDTISRFHLDKPMLRAGFVIAAYSGGADSSCLLRFLKQWCAAHGVSLAAAHVNHMIRGEDAMRDEAFCRETCEELGIPIFVLREDVPKLSRESGRGLEETARLVRYSFFDKVSKELTGNPDLAVVATAHNADDNLETVIFHLLRGSGTHGLSGIDPIRDGRYVRPLLCDSGSTIRQWCTENHVSYVTDATNADTDYTRNFIRHNIVPQMEKICESPQRSALRLTTLLRQDDEYLAGEAGRYVQGEETSLSRKVLAGLSPAIGSRVARLLYDNALHAKDGSASIEEVHIREILRAVTSDASQTTRSLPGKITFAMDRHTVRFADGEDLPHDETVDDGRPAFSYPADGDIFENQRYIIKFSHSEQETTSQINENIYKFFICKTFCFDKIINTLQIRYRRPGDVYLYGGMKRKVKKLFIDKKLTADEKSSLPLLCDGEEIIWIPGFPPKDGVSPIKKDTGPRLYITCYFKM